MEYGLVLPSVLLIAFVALASMIVKAIRIFVFISKFEGPPALPLVGNAHTFKSDQREFFVDMRHLMDEYRARSGGLMRMWLGPVPALVLYKAKHMEVVLNSTRHIRKGYIYKFLEPWLGLGLLTSSGQKWFHRRKLLTPTFHFSILQSFLDVFNEQSMILVKKLEEFTENSAPVNIFPLITYCVLDIICITAMGRSSNAQGDEDNEYVKAVSRMSELLTVRGKNSLLWPDFIFKKLEIGKEHDRTLKILHDATNKMIQERLQDSTKDSRSSCKDDDDGSGGDGSVTRRRKRIAFLDLLLQMHREDASFTLDDIREEVDTFMFEGHDTTAAAAGWAIFLIGHHPDVQARLHMEMDQVFDGKVVPKETLVALSIYGLHQDPEEFPNPDRFDPDRFLPENAEKRHPYAYVPFSAGPRNCIGQKFAMMEEKTLLASILRKFSIKSVQTVEEAKPAGQLIIRPIEGSMLVKLSRRK
ncbi:cytochrome P450 4V2-like isoform X2 [Lytechinus variegatus]|uniref:cytochrome P450 4V2-like isoform X2 n=1 Tax=Lytechinus variegatus TaxID=7654 RepID=UPI001BB24395|nr:cytochrome P450 4V2-like isoform X2 [Lytechinus variegatus]